MTESQQRAVRRELKNIAGALDDAYTGCFQAVRQMPEGSAIEEIKSMRVTLDEFRRRILDLNSEFSG
jgi:hypothetical protein